MSSIVKAIERTHKWADDNNWPVVYWAVDLHGTVLKPSYERQGQNFAYPHALECLKAISANKNNVLIMFSSSWPDRLLEHREDFRALGIDFKYINVNPEVQTNLKGHGYYFDKFYFNVMLEDKAGFDPDSDWLAIIEYMKSRHEK